MIVGVLLMLVTVLAAELDHAHKRRVMNRLEVDEWYCQHRQTRCPKESSAAVERRWNGRQHVYTIAVASSGIATIAAAGGWLRRNRRRRALDP